MMDEPVWLVLARQDIGQRETLGPNDSPRIRAMLKAFKLDWLMGQPWCGTIMGDWMTKCGIAPPPSFFRAKAWADWGSRITNPVPGCVAVFARDGGGHVGLVVAQDAGGRLLVLGGNQGNSVSIAPFDKGRAIAFRWPAGRKLDGIGLPTLASTQASSTNEA